MKGCLRTEKQRGTFLIVVVAAAWFVAWSVVSITVASWQPLLFSTLDLAAVGLIVAAGFWALTWVERGDPS